MTANVTEAKRLANTENERNGTHPKAITYSAFFTPSSKWCLEGQKQLIAKVADMGETREAYRLLWDKWHSFRNRLPRQTFTLDEADRYETAFRYLIGRMYRKPETKEENLKEIRREYIHARKNFYLNRWNFFVQNVGNMTAQDCKRTREAFTEWFDMVFRTVAEEHRHLIWYRMSKEYMEAYAGTGRISLKDIDPDRKYASDEETETHCRLQEVRATLAGIEDMGLIANYDK